MVLGLGNRQQNACMYLPGMIALTFMNEGYPSFQALQVQEVQLVQYVR